MTDDEWAYFEPFLIHRGGGRPPRNHRRVLDAVFWLMRTGAPWRDLPEGFGNWNSIFRQFRRWADSGVWDVILEGLAGSGVSDAALQMIDATIIRAHHCAAGGKGGPAQRARSFAWRLLNQNQRPHQCRGSADRRCDYARAGTRCHGVSGLDAGDRCDPEQMLGDNGYDSEAVRNDIEERGGEKPQSPALQPGKYSMPSTRLSMPCAIASSASSIVRRTHAVSPPATTS